MTTPPRPSAAPPGRSNPSVYPIDTNPGPHPAAPPPCTEPNNKAAADGRTERADRADRVERAGRGCQAADFGVAGLRSAEGRGAGGPGEWLRWTPIGT